MTSPAFVATFVVAASRPTLSDAFLASAAQVSRASGTRWLDAGVAADVFFPSHDEIPAIRERLEALSRDAKADVIVQPVASRVKRLLIADMDSTLIAQECIDELAAAIGVGPHVAGITERAMRGEIEFEGALRERVALLKNLPFSVIDEVLRRSITLNAGAKTLAATMRARGGYFAIVSGGFTPFTGEIARRLGAHEHRANRLAVEDGKLTGKVIEPILGSQAKLEALKDISAKLGVSREQTMGVGDGANDLPMLRASGLGVAYRAKPKVAAAADARVDHADLTALLYAQGIRREEFVDFPGALAGGSVLAPPSS
jgi:phosphoserine phosphatase